MVAIYIAAFLVGIAILVFGIVAGNLDHSIDAHDSGDGDGHVFIPFLSPRFWIYGLGSFGLAGILSTLAGIPNALVIAIVCGLITGLSISYFTKYVLRRAETTSSMRMDSLLGKTGNVTVPIRQSSVGKIQLSQQGEVLELFAKAHNPDSEILHGAAVVVVGVEGNTLEVMPQDNLLD
jgi:membrane protein implicated in regulation of membrane protease activity